MRFGKRETVMAVGALLVLLGGWWGWQRWRQPADHGDGGGAEEVASEANIVSLPPEKLVAAKIETTPVVPRQLRAVRIVPARARYDDTRHIEVKLPTEGILADVLVKPGDEVAAGQVLALLHSPEVGNARADVLRRRAERALAETKLGWERTTATGLAKLVEAVEEHQDPQAILSDMESVALGEHREKVMTAYTRFRLAETLAANVTSLSDTGAVPVSTIQQRRSERDAAAAALVGLTEQLRFESRQRLAMAQTDADDATRRLKIAEQHLETLLGYQETIEDPTPRSEREQGGGAKDNSAAEVGSTTAADSPAASAGPALSLVEVRAAFAGTIEAKRFSASERVAQGDTLFVLADTSRLWVAADIREREWTALRLRPGEPLEVASPALPDMPLTATVYFIGREVDPQTNAVPLVATIDNGEGLLRPGQFLRVKLPLEETHESLAIPESSVLEHDGVKFVFVREGEDRFRRIDVRIGPTEEGWTQVLSGLAEGKEVVAEGAFYLKSELLLEGEE